MRQNKRKIKKIEKKKFHTKFNNNFRLAKKKIKSFNKKTFPSDLSLLSFQFNIFCYICYSFSSMLEKKKVLFYSIEQFFTQ